MSSKKDWIERFYWKIYEVFHSGFYYMRNDFASVRYYGTFDSSSFTYIGLEYLKGYMDSVMKRDFFSIPMEQVLADYKRVTQSSEEEMEYAESMLRSLHANGFLPVKFSGRPESVAYTEDTLLFMVESDKAGFKWLVLALKDLILDEIKVASEVFMSMRYCDSSLDMFRDSVGMLEGYSDEVRGILDKHLGGMSTSAVHVKLSDAREMCLGLLLPNARPVYVQGSNSGKLDEGNEFCYANLNCGDLFYTCKPCSSYKSEEVQSIYCVVDDGVDISYKLEPMVSKHLSDFLASKVKGYRRIATVSLEATYFSQLLTSTCKDNDIVIEIQSDQELNRFVQVILPLIKFEVTMFDHTIVLDLRYRSATIDVLSYYYIYDNKDKGTRLSEVLNSFHVIGGRKLRLGYNNELSCLSIDLCNGCHHDVIFKRFPLNGIELKIMEKVCFSQMGEEAFIKENGLVVLS